MRMNSRSGNKGEVERKPLCMKREKWWSGLLAELQHELERNPCGPALVEFLETEGKSRSLGMCHGLPMLQWITPSPCTLGSSTWCLSY